MKKRKYRFLWMLCLILCLTVLSHICVSAAQPLEVSVEESRVEDGKLLVYVNSSLEREDQALASENFQISLGGSDIPCEDVRYFSDTDEPIAYIYLVDVSGSISPQKLQKMKDFLKSLTQNLREQDKVCLITFGDQLSIGEFTGDKNALAEQIDQIQGLGEDTNLYQSIVDSLKLMESGEHGADRKALLILSDGEDDQAAGITREEVDDCLEKIRVPVYTAAMLDEDSPKEQQEFAKILGSFARQSAGGFHTIFQGEEISVEEGAAKIVTAIADGMVLSGDLSEYQTGNGQAYLQVTLKVDGLGQASDGYLVSERSLGMEAEKNTDEPNTDEQESDEQNADDQKADGQNENDRKADAEHKSINSKLWIAVAAAAVVCLALLLLFFVIRRKNRQQRENEEEEAAKQREEGEYQETAQVIEQESEEISEQENPQSVKAENEEEHSVKCEDEKENEEKRENEADVSRQWKEAVPEKVIWMAKIGLLEEATFEIRIRGEVVFGRQNQKADYAFPEDSLISAVHCSITAVGEDLVLCDKGSKNGTFVNGIPITAPYVLKCDDVIHMGRTDFRVYW